MTTASGHAHARGRSDISNEKGASNSNVHNIAPTQCDGRHSRRQGADTIDERRNFDIAGDLLGKEPAPDPIVFAVQHPQECRALRCRTLPPLEIQPAFQQPVEFTHAAPASPAQALDFKFVRHAVLAPGRDPGKRRNDRNQARRASINCLMLAIASAGFSPFGQVRVQFMMVWQRYSLNGSSSSSRRVPVSSSRLSTIQR